MSTRDRRGFTILEAVIALAVVGLAGVTALEAVGGEIRAAGRAADAYTLSALAQDRLAAVTFLSARSLAPLPDSVARGRFSPPFDTYRWTTQVSPVRDGRWLYDVIVKIEGDQRDYVLRTRLYRPIPMGILR